MKIKYCIGYVVLFSLCINASYGQDSWKIDSAQVVFHINNAGLDVTGSIAGISGNIKFSKNKLTKSSFIASAKSETIQTGIKLRDKHLKKADYFDVEKYPIMTISSKQITKAKNGFEATCTLSLKGQNKDIVIPFTFDQTTTKAQLKGSFELNRLDYGIGEKSIILSDQVRIEIWVSATAVMN